MRCKAGSTCLKFCQELDSLEADGANDSTDAALQTRQRRTCGSWRTSAHKLCHALCLHMAITASVMRHMCK